MSTKDIYVEDTPEIKSDFKMKISSNSNDKQAAIDLFINKVHYNMKVEIENILKIEVKSVCSIVGVDSWGKSILYKFLTGDTESDNQMSLFKRTNDDIMFIDHPSPAYFLSDGLPQDTQDLLVSLSDFIIVVLEKVTDKDKYFVNIQQSIQRVCTGNDKKSPQLIFIHNLYENPNWENMNLGVKERDSTKNLIYYYEKKDTCCAYHLSLIADKSSKKQIGWNIDSTDFIKKLIKTEQSLAKSFYKSLTESISSTFHSQPKISLQTNLKDILNSSDQGIFSSKFKISVPTNDTNNIIHPNTKRVKSERNNVVIPSEDIRTPEKDPIKWKKPIIYGLSILMVLFVIFSNTEVSKSYFSLVGGQYHRESFITDELVEFVSERKVDEGSMITYQKDNGYNEKRTVDRGQFVLKTTDKGYEIEEKVWDRNSPLGGKFGFKTRGPGAKKIVKKWVPITITENVWVPNTIEESTWVPKLEDVYVYRSKIVTYKKFNIYRLYFKVRFDGIKEFYRKELIRTYETRHE
ncbi:hypothetical protein DLAC_09795 [Tieghemostelium lacteum]|uniref:Uncharacterized protein n=1 Tax=Tieghemostelium lacteum TaxID=361077 RepID=A0A151Z778_TIELA|nr:hypothetical protein DLAC_09795 [Tieghemostelium lacteum]|eukprot:KYQ89821.1 hypothetical protein DLAC_09795 [Tieghemostelium lacteum]